jgi:hypothetical protein
MKFNRKAVTVDAVELLYPTTITTPKGVQRANKGDYLVNMNGDQFLIEKTIFELTYDIASEPDTIAPLEVSNLTASNITDTSVTFAYTTPADADFKQVNVYQDGVLLSSRIATGDAQYTITGLTASTTYTFLFTTVDNAGNESTGVTQSITTLATPVAP